MLGFKKYDPSKFIEHLYTYFDLTNFSAFTYEYLTDSWMRETETASQAKKGNIKLLNDK